MKWFNVDILIEDTDNPHTLDELDRLLAKRLAEILVNNLRAKEIVVRKIIRDEYGEPVDEEILAELTDNH